MSDEQPIPQPVVDILQPYFLTPVPEILNRPAVGWGGVSAVQWVANGHSWLDVTDVMTRVLN